MAEIKLTNLAEEDAACFANHLGVVEEWGVGKIAEKLPTDEARPVGGMAAREALDLEDVPVAAPEKII